MALTQAQIYEIERRKIASLNEAFMDLVNHPTNPMTREDLKALIIKRPERYERFSGFLDKLPSTTAAGPDLVCWEHQANREPIRLSFSIKVF
jgi:hypothetical protein